MKNFTLLSLLLLSFSSYAQNDSTRLDLGGIVLKKAFTQYISIKGEDLEKMPFSNLAEAINVWLYGEYATPGNLVFVVDGNVVSDVNTYNVHDIEEVVLVQHAAALMGTGGNQQQIVLVTTRKGEEKFGLRGAAQSLLVHTKGTGTDVFHQYYVGGWRNLDKIGFGVSANYLHDVTPSVKGEGIHISDPLNMDRWRLNGYFTWTPDKKNTVEAHVGYTPQSIDQAETYSLPIYQYPKGFVTGSHEHTNQFITWARWRGEWAPGLRNDLQAGYMSSKQTAQAYSLDQNTDVTAERNYMASAADQPANHLYIRDRVSYQLHAEGWSFEPSFNASYEHYNSRSAAAWFIWSGVGADPSAMPTQQSISNTQHKSDVYLLTPTMDIGYRQWLDLQGGVVINVSHAGAGTTGIKRVFPFASLGLDLLHIGNSGAGNSLKLFGSYAKRGTFTYNDLALDDLSGWASALSGTNTAVVFTSGTAVFPGYSLPEYWVWETGAHFATRDDRLRIDYNFERRNFNSAGYFEINQGGGTTVMFAVPEWKSSQHYIGVSVKIIDGPAFSWRSGVNTTVLRSKANSYPDYLEKAPIGDYVKSNNKPSWTGGWVNRIRYQRFSVGIDMLYHFSKEVPGLDYRSLAQLQRDDYALLQNIYLAYQVHLPGKTGLEVYIDSRGTINNNVNPYMDNRRFYGVGGKITI